jgi:hypothetical protein
MTHYTPVSLGDMARINDALRTVELSLLWYGTRDPSPGRLRRFVVEQGAADLEEAMDLLRVRTEAGTCIGSAEPGDTQCNLGSGPHFGNKGSAGRVRAALLVYPDVLLALAPP